MIRKILFFVIALLLIGCNPKRVQQSDSESPEAQICGLVTDLQQQAENLDVEFNADSLKQLLMETPTEEEVKRITREAGLRIVERYRAVYSNAKTLDNECWARTSEADIKRAAERHQQRVQETKEIIVETGLSAMEKALAWRFEGLRRLADSPGEDEDYWVDPGTRIKAHNMYIWLAANEAPLLQSFERGLREYLDQNPPQVPANGELIKCLREACRYYEICYRNCNVTDDLCWHRCEMEFYRRIAACPGMLPGAQK